MTTYNVHIYREMKLLFLGVEAETPQAAAEAARTLTLNDTVYENCLEECEGPTFAALVDVQGDKEYAHTRLIEFEEERLRKAAPALLAACQMVVERWERGDLAEAARACSTAIAEAESAGIAPVPPTATVPAKKPYSVLLLYPDWATDYRIETYYAWVEASDPIAAVAEAQRQAVAVNDWGHSDPSDFAPLLVTQGHHYGEPTSSN
jgi:hypothetical protein